MSYAEIRDFLNTYYEIDGRIVIRGFKVWVYGNVVANPHSKFNFENLTNNLFEFAEVTGDFDCSYFFRLKSLENGPEVVGGNYIIHGCKELTSLVGSPLKVKGDFEVKHLNITSLKGCTPVIGGKFDIRGNEKLKSLQYCPTSVGGDFIVQSCKSLKSLRHVPKVLNKDFNCAWCSSLTTLKYGPKVVNGVYTIYGCPIESLEGCPSYIDGYFEMGYNKELKSLQGFPSHLKGSFYIVECPKLESFEGIKPFEDDEFGFRLMPKHLSDEISKRPELRKKHLRTSSWG